MKRARRRRQQGDGGRTPVPHAAPAASAVDRRRAAAGPWLVAATLAVPPFLVVALAADGFRLPQRMAVEWLALASLVALAAALPPRAFDLRTLAASPALHACLPLLLLATLSLATTRHRLHVLDALADLAIATAALVGWSLAFRAERLRRVLDATLLAAGPLALLGILQAHRLWTPLGFLADPGDARQATTSLLGNPGDLAALLVLPCLLAQQRLAAGPRRPLWAAVAVLCAYGVAASQTLTSFAALAAGSVLLWALLLPPRRLLATAVASVVVVALLVALAPGLRGRVLGWSHTFALGGINNVLSGRLDGWRVASALLAERPLAGVGHGAYRAEFAPAKLALAARGVPFYEHHINPSFANAHNEYLEVGAGLGWPGLLALLWGVGVIAVAARRRRGASRHDGALAWGGLLALALLALAYFPFRIGPVAFGWVAFLAWLCAGRDGEGERS